ncbi:hypothetical protein M422DRAFT_26923 [Sphaerobolus stellatus SS14]|nr:hypothetical protein M422DRAFT_26923 [Sphaerobolus stellatus SS14]
MPSFFKRLTIKINNNNDAPAHPPPPATAGPATTSFDHSSVTIRDFELQKVIGKGTYSRVRIVKHHKTGNLYALKYVDKQLCLRKNVADHIIQERSVLEQIKHPFIVNMHLAFQDDMNCYFVLDLMLGGDIRFQRHRAGTLGEDAVRFMVAEISSALAYLHQNGICHRDVKAENILLDSQGHAHLTDFNAAFRFTEGEYRREVVGTMVYMAPEMLDRKGYSWQIDYFSLGVTAYEYLFGRRPFAYKCKEADAIKEAIMTEPLIFPGEKQVSREGISAIAALLEREPTQRLGCLNLVRRTGQIDLRSHRWFRKLDWKKLDTKRLVPPFIPIPRSTNLTFEDVNSENTPATVENTPSKHNKRRTRGVSMMPEAKTSEMLRLEYSFGLPEHSEARAAYKAMNRRRSVQPPPLSNGMAELDQNALQLTYGIIPYRD